MITHAFHLSSFNMEMYITFLIKYVETSGYNAKHSVFCRLHSFKPTSDASLVIIVRDNQEPISDVSRYTGSYSSLAASSITLSEIQSHFYFSLDCHYGLYPQNRHLLLPRFKWDPTIKLFLFTFNNKHVGIIQTCVSVIFHLNH